ncbi:MAG: hypothetical protein KIC92_05895 [Clostridiales bacterium]|nr:hypothetical protein [Clostridiales bacterium]
MGLLFILSGLLIVLLYTALTATILRIMEEDERDFRRKYINTRKSVVYQKLCPK